MPRPMPACGLISMYRRDIQSDYRHGVFSQPGKRYKSWVRFSNGHYDLKTSNDYKNDARGMALKLMEINGQPLEQSDAEQRDAGLSDGKHPRVFCQEYAGL